MAENYQAQEITDKQKAALAAAVVKGGSFGKALRNAGYSKAMAKNPKKVKESKGFQELIKKYLPDELLAKVHKDGIMATKSETVWIGKGESELQDVPDFAVRHRYLETAYKLKGYVNQPEQGNKTLVINITGETATRYGLLPQKGDAHG